MDRNLLDYLGITGRKASGREHPQLTSHADQRRTMVETQIARRGISNERVLRALMDVPRHAFVPPHLQDRSYDDSPLPIGSGQTISQPYIVAYMTEKLQLESHHRVLEIGTGSGYQAGVMAQLAQEVFTIEIIEHLGKHARELFGELGYKNVRVNIGDGTLGWPEEAPFDAIMVTAAPRILPEILLDQLDVGGRMILPVGDLFQYLYLFERTESGVQEQRLLPVRFVPMTGRIDR